MRWSEPPGLDPHRDVSGALHDVSNVLTVLLGWVAEAQAARSSPEELEQALAIIEDRARAARDLARRAIGANTTVDDREESIDAVVAGVVRALAVEADRADVSLCVVGAHPTVQVPLATDASQILTNVLMNALAWAPAGTRVVIEVATEGADVRVTVQDDGPGVPSALVDSVFAGGSGREGGAGIGLRHARALARAAGGDLELVTGSSRKGACFQMRWPCTRPILSQRPSTPPRGASLRGRKVLVLEDDADVATLLVTALGARGAEVEVARTAAELLERVSGDHDAVLVDLSPIADDVAGALDALRRTAPRAVVVFISGSAAALPDVFADEAIRWVRKPFEISEVLDALSDVWRR